MWRSQDLNTYFQIEHAMVFQMGLNESFTPMRSQLLFMEVEPSVNHTFSLVIQEANEKAL